MAGIFNNYDQGLAITGASFSSGALYQSFTVPTGITTVTGADFYFLGPAGSTIDAVSAFFLADSSAKPGAVIASLGQLDRNGYGMTFYAGAGCSTGVLINQPVTPGTRYWIKLQGTTTASWGITSNSGLGTATELRTDSTGTVYQAASGLFQMIVWS